MAALINNPAKSDDEIISDGDLEDLDDVMDSEYASEEDEDEDECVRLTEPKKNSIYNRDGLLDKLRDISWPEDVDWKHKLTVDFDQEQAVDVNDDLTRELAFYTQGLEGTRQAFLKFETMGLPFLRPPDYYSGMVKTDSHMEKVEGRLLPEKKRIEEAEERRKARENKKKSKEVQVQKQKERIKQKKDDIEVSRKGGSKDSKVGFRQERKMGIWVCLLKMEMALKRVIRRDLGCLLGIGQVGRQNKAEGRRKRVEIRRGKVGSLRILNLDLVGRKV